jgi:hypothetical protein
VGVARKISLFNRGELVQIPSLRMVPGTDSKTCYIDKIPTEILQHILSFVTTPISNWELASGEHDNILPPVHLLLALKAVSRRFRMITNQLDYWQNHEFLISGHSREPSERYIRVLLNDKELVSALNRKKGWTFSSSIAFLIIKERIKNLGSNTTSISLRRIRFDLSMVIHELKNFTNLNALKIVFEPGSPSKINLDPIVEACPGLKTLDLIDMPEHWGTLKRVATLQKLKVTWKSNNNPDLLSSLLPFNSTKSLQSLGLERIDATITNDFTRDQFNQFFNLKHFTIYDFTPTFCDMVSHGKFALSNLDITFSEIPYITNPEFRSVLSMLCAPSLQSLNHLILGTKTISVTQETEAATRQLVCSIAKLPNLQILELKLLAFLSGFKYFADSKLRHLKSISYVGVEC